MTRTFPVIKARVPWSEYQWEFIHGYKDGLPLLSYGWAPRELLATRRQLRGQDLRPNGADPVAVLYSRHRGSGKVNYSNLWLIETAAPVRPMTTARRTAVETALAARRRCAWCGEDTGRYQPRDQRDRLCDACIYEYCDLEPWEYLAWFPHEPLPVPRELVTA